MRDRCLRHTACRHATLEPKRNLSAAWLAAVGVPVDGLFCCCQSQEALVKRFFARSSICGSVSADKSTLSTAMMRFAISE